MSAVNDLLSFRSRDNTRTPDTGSYNGYSQARSQSRNTSQLSFDDDSGHLSPLAARPYDNDFEHGSPASSHRDTTSDWAANLNNNVFSDNQQIDIPGPQILIDVLVKLMSLKPEQASDLHEVANCSKDLGKSQLFMGLTIVANQFNLTNEITSLKKHQTETNAILEEVKKFINQKWQMNEELKDNVHLTAKDLIFNAMQIDYAHLKSRVRDALEKIPEFHDIFLSPHRTKIVVREIGDKCRGVKNSFRKAIRDLTFGTNRLSMEDVIRELAKRFALAGTAKLDYEHFVRIAILRRFARENPEVLNIEEPADDEDEDPSANKENDAETESGTGKRRRRGDGAASKSVSKKGHGGRVPKGMDWWSQVDKWFLERRKEWGDNMKSPQWKSYIRETFRLENFVIEDPDDNPNEGNRARDDSDGARDRGSSTEGALASISQWRANGHNSSFNSSPEFHHSGQTDNLNWGNSSARANSAASHTGRTQQHRRDYSDQNDSRSSHYRGNVAPAPNNNNQFVNSAYQNGQGPATLRQGTAHSHMPSNMIFPPNAASGGSAVSGLYQDNWANNPQQLSVQQQHSRSNGSRYDPVTEISGGF